MVTIVRLEDGTELEVEGGYYVAFCTDELQVLDHHFNPIGKFPRGAWVRAKPAPPRPLPIKRREAVDDLHEIAYGPV